MKIQSTNDIAPTKLNTLITGESGAGKTTLLGTLPGKTIVIDAEGGLLPLKGKGVAYVSIEGNTGAEKLNSLTEILKEISKSDYKNVCIDSLSEIATYFVDHAAELYPDDRQALKKWGRYSESITKFIKFTRDMNKNIIFTALLKTSEDNMGRRFNLPDIPGSMAKKIPQFFDMVFNLSVIENENEEKRALLTANHEGFNCKDRSGKLNKYEPANLGAIISKCFEEEAPKKKEK